MSDLFDGHNTASTESVQCLGQLFASEQARREHFTKLLADKLRDPAFRKTEGFPLGTDEAILAMSDPPFHTACPNPFMQEFLATYTAKPKAEHKSQEPFYADVSEGKNDPIYNAHSYHTKVPHKAVMRYILHYTNPGDLVADLFCGTGMTGVAAKLCGDRAIVESLGYRVDSDGVVSRLEKDGERTVWVKFSKLGARIALLNDLSPSATFIASNYNAPIAVDTFEAAARAVLAGAVAQFSWMYETLHQASSDQIVQQVAALDSNALLGKKVSSKIGRINYMLWSDVFVCPECSGDVIYWDAALDRDKGVLKDTFNCPHCNAEVSKRNLARAYVSDTDSALRKVVRHGRQVPVEVNYSFGGKTYVKRPDGFDLALLEKIGRTTGEYQFPSDAIMFKGERWGDTWRAGYHDGITHVHHCFRRLNNEPPCRLNIEPGRIANC